MSGPATAPLDGGVTDALSDWLSDGLPESAPPFVATRITGGYSMLTYRMADDAGTSWVLRHPPAGRHTGGAHDVGREARAMSALLSTSVAVPRVRLVGTAGDPLGVPCHVTDFVDGHVLSDAESAERLLTPAALTTASREIVTMLGALHSVDADAVGLGELGPRSDYVARQLHRWRRSAEEAADGPAAVQAAALIALADGLAASVPRDDRARLVHGDYRLGNAIIAPDGTIRAVVDWELVTLGEPLADLGMLAAFWDPPAVAMLGVRMPTSASGAISVSQALDLYAEVTGDDLSDLGFHYRMACWRLAGTAVRAAGRYASGAMGQSRDLAVFRDAADTWIALADEPLV